MYQWEQSVPALISDGGSATYRSVSCGLYHTCALRSDGQAVCFGENGYGQCGDGLRNDPVRTPTVVAGGVAFKHIAAGQYHTCGLRASDGRAMCFGVCYGLAAAMGGGRTAIEDVQTVVRFQSTVWLLSRVQATETLSAISLGKTLQRQPTSVAPTSSHALLPAPTIRVH